MPLSEVDYKLVTEYSVTGYPQPFVNVYYYKSIADPASAGNLASLWSSSIRPALQGILSTFVNTSIVMTAYNMVDLDDFAQQVATLQGSFTAPSGTTNFLAAGFTLFRSTRQNKRQGAKRYGPLAEEMIAGDSPTGSYLTALNAMAAALDANLSGSGLEFQLCIPRSVLVDNPNAPPAQIYQIQDIFPVAEVEFSNITTQNSRKAF